MSYMGRKKKTTVCKLAVMLGLALIGCNSPKAGDHGDGARKGAARGFAAPPEEAGDQSAYRPIWEPGVPVGPGFGVDLNNHKGIPNKCLDGSIESIPQQEGYMSLDSDFTASEVESSLGTSVDGHVNYLLWGGSARASFAQKSKEMAYGLNYAVFVYNKHHSKVFLPKQRSESWRSSSPEEWYASCGGGYVAAQDFGSMLVIRFSLTLEDKEMERQWGAGGDANYLSFAKLKTSISSNTKSKKAKGTLSLSAIQIGGIPAELGKVLKSDSSNGLIQTFALCDVADVAKCLEGLRAIENYVANEFPKQMKDETNGGPALLKTYPFLYPKTMGSEFNPGIDRFVIKAREDLAKLYDEEMSDVEALKRHEKSANDEEKVMLQKAQNNVADIREASALCFESSSYARCAARAEELAIACSETDVPEHMSASESGQSNSGSNSGE